MTERERLLEEFDDAYFALLMEGVANKEGEQLIALNEMLQNNPEAAVPESVDKRCLETIDRHFAREQRRIGLRKAGKVLRLAAVIMGISVLLFTSAFALSEDFRVATLNLMLTVTERYTQFDINNSDGNSVQASPKGNQAGSAYFQNAEINWIPEGFECIECIPDTRVRFGNEQGDYFTVHIMPGSGSINVDTENPESLEYITINGNEGLCVVKYGEVSITLADLENYLYIGVYSSSGISVETAKKIAENISIIDENSSYSREVNTQYFQNAEIGWVPEGFECTESVPDILARFENEQGEYFLVSIVSGHGTMRVDTENPESLEHITVNGYEGLCTVKYGEVSITLADLENDLYIGVDASSGISVETAKKIAENILIL